MWYALELIASAILLYGLITQIIVPLIRNTPLLPLWNNETRLYSELRDVHQGRIEAEVAADVDALKAEVERLVAERKRKNAAAPDGSTVDANKENK